MFFRKKTTKPTMSLYLTHGSLMVMKGVARTQSQNELHIIAMCNFMNDEKTYQIKNINDLKNRLLEVKHPQQEAMLQYIKDHQDTLTQKEFFNYVNTIKKYFKIGNVNLRADGNLFHPNSDNVSKELCDLVNTTRPQSLVLFSDTPACVADSQKYLRRELTNKYHHLPSYSLSGNVADRKTLKDVITHEKKQPTIIPVPNACWGFFSRRIKDSSKLQKVYASDDTHEVSLDSDRTTKYFLFPEPKADVIDLLPKHNFYNRASTLSDDDRVRAFHSDL
ncbi:MAG: hypothetical protein P1U36_09705 [Legionellaceae bacterium]|nr:hypothetical protein [Legionellaceae bacterium]